LLSADILYIADSARNVPAYSPANNDLYQALDNDGDRPVGASREEHASRR